MRFARIIPLLLFAASIAACTPSDRAANSICGPHIYDCAATISTVQATVTATGHRCDAVDWVGKLAANEGYYFSCNRHAYAYQIGLHDGRWFVIRK